MKELINLTLIDPLQFRVIVKVLIGWVLKVFMVSENFEFNLMLTKKYVFFGYLQKYDSLDGCI